MRALHPCSPVKRQIGSRGSIAPAFTREDREVFSRAVNLDYPQVALC